jgi:hypothetical protein
MTEPDTIAVEDNVLQSVSDWDASAVRALSVALAWSAEPLRLFARPLDYWADVLDDPSLSGDLARLSMRRALRIAKCHRGCGELLERLEGVTEPPWPEVRAALAEGDP